MTDTSPDWVQEERDFIASLRSQAEDLLTKADEDESASEQLAKEAAISVEYADLGQAVLDARLAVKNGNGDAETLRAAEEELTTFRDGWRTIYAMNHAGHSQEAAATAAENEG
jgi:hypothetical protein